MDSGDEEKWKEFLLNFPFHKIGIKLVPTW